MTKDKLSNFRINQEKYDQFVSLCEEQGTDVSKALVAYVDACLKEEKLIVPPYVRIEIPADKLEAVRRLLEGKEPTPQS